LIFSKFDRDRISPDLELQIRLGPDIVELRMTQVSDKQLEREMIKQLNTMLIISHKHYINTNSRDCTLLFCLIYDIREAL